jgi:hypothetical protein
VDSTDFAGKLDGAGEELRARTQDEPMDPIDVVMADDVEIREFIGFEVSYQNQL